MLVLVVGPSGAGKDTLLDGAREHLRADPRFHFARRDITRPPTPGGEAHNPVDPATFAATRYALSWHAHGFSYGIRADIEDELAAGHVVVASVSRGVIADAAVRYPVLVLEITAPPEVLASRLAARAREPEADIAARLARNISLPAGIAVERVMNDGTIAASVAKVVAVLSRAAESARPG